MKRSEARKAAEKRAGDRCECTGQCDTHAGRCTIMRGQMSLFGSTESMTMTPTVRSPRDWRPVYWKSLCSTCVKRYQTADVRRRSESAAASEDEG